MRFEVRCPAGGRVRAARFVAAVVTYALSCGLSLASAIAPPPASAAELGPRLQYLRCLREGAPASLRDRGVIETASAGELLVSIRFASAPSHALLAALEEEGVRFVTHNGSRLHTATVFPAYVSWPALEPLRAHTGIIAIESAWRPHSMRPLDVSRPEVEADIVATINARDGRLLTGENVVIADFDTGIDVFHPMFWRADGDTLAWLDRDQDGQFDPGTDGVDRDGNGRFGPGEILSYMESPVFGGITNDPAVFGPDIDWLYNDENGNGIRDRGRDAGFTEADPTFGEAVYIALDRNGNGALDRGERVVALRTSKVRAIYETTGRVRRRGVDLMESQGDTYGHGTQVAGILAGGTAGRSRFAGIAPGAELLMGNNAYITQPPFIVTLEILIPWALAEGADVMLYEDGEWVWNFLDGSSNVETMIDETAALGIPQVVPAGNLATGRMHTRARIAAGATAALILSEPSGHGESLTDIWPTILWRGAPDDVAIELQSPSGTRLALDGSGDFDVLNGWLIYSYVSVSPRGTAKMDVQIVSGSSGTVLNGDWTFHLENHGGREITVHGYTCDNVSSWSGFGTWRNPAPDRTTTVTWPATADSAITVGAYRPRGMPGLNDFSGQGPRIDGRPILDLAAPGTTVFTPAPLELVGETGGFGAFGGTSAAGPHVAAAAAILKQYARSMGFRELDTGELRKRLRDGARHDAVTGEVPNEKWGYGKLRILRALDLFAGGLTTGDGGAIGAPASPPDGVNGLSLRVSPNPAGAREISIAYALARPGAARLELFDAHGRRVALLRDIAEGAGADHHQWDGRLSPDRRIAPGTYFVRLTQGNTSTSSKVILLP